MTRCEGAGGGCEGAACGKQPGEWGSAEGLPAPGVPVGDGVTALGSLARRGLVAGLCCLVSASGAVLPCVLYGVSVLPRLSLPHPTGGCWRRSKARLRLLCAHPEPTAVVGMGVESGGSAWAASLWHWAPPELCLEPSCPPHHGTACPGIFSIPQRWSQGLRVLDLQEPRASRALLVCAWGI